MATQNQFGFQPDEIRAFTQGDCWALALALHEATGWQLVAIGYSDEWAQPLEYRSWEHVGVRRADGKVVDITGVHEEPEWLARWHNPAYGATFETEARHFCDFKRVWDHVPSMYAKEILGQLEVAPVSAAA